MSQQSAAEYLRHGQMPFFRLPVADAASAAPYAGTDAVLLGVPYDGAVTYQPGARLAPYHLRRTSALLQTFHPVHRVDVFRAIRVLDGGNVAFPPFDAGAVRHLVQAEVGAIVAAGASPFVVGGDHSVALPAMRAVAAAHGPLAVLHVDAHLDTSGPEVWGEAFHHGAPLRHALTEGLIAPGQLFQVGLRASWGHPEEGALVAAHGAHGFPMPVVEARGIEAIAPEIRDAIGDRPLYVTFDVDGIDPAFAPGTGTPVPGGLTAREALQLLRGLAGARLVGMDVVEISPALDHADLTCHLGAWLLYEGLALRALRIG
jgi:agmatinase